jgi:osmoprotectant transport system substrate-binding protein
MRTVMRAALGAAVALAAVGLVAGCGKAGSSSLKTTVDASGNGCKPVAGKRLTLLKDDRMLQTADNVLPAVNTKAADASVLSALSKVSAAVGARELVLLNKATDVDRKSSKDAAVDFAASTKIADGIGKGPGGTIVVGAANFSESQTLAELYRIVLAAAGFDASVRVAGDRSAYEPMLEKGEIQVVPEYLGSITEFLNKKVNGDSASTIASGDAEQTESALTPLGEKVGITFGALSAAANQNAFAVTSTLADKYKLHTLSDFAARCSGAQTVLGGPSICPHSAFCQPGLQKAYKMTFGKFASLDSGGPLTKKALTGGTVTIGLVFSSDSALS